MGGDVRNLRNVGNGRNVENIRRDRKTLSVIHFPNQKLELT